MANENRSPVRRTPGIKHYTYKEAQASSFLKRIGLLEVQNDLLVKRIEALEAKKEKTSKPKAKDPE